MLVILEPSPIHVIYIYRLVPVFIIQLHFVEYK